jgi:GNAT superfamily N-acetyltransferase
VQIKPLSDIEYAAWLPLWQAYQTFYKTTLSDSVNTLTWQRLSDTTKHNMYGFAALIDNQLVGIVHMVEHESCWTERPYAYLQDLYVIPAARGKGIARGLIEYIGEYCHSHCDRVYWLTHESNETARALYDQVAKQTGFIQYRMS